MVEYASSKGISNNDFTMRKTIPLLIALIIIQGTGQWLETTVASTFIWWIIDGIILLFFLFCKEFKEYRLPKIASLYLIWVVISAIRGVYLAEGYWDYKSLVSSLFFYLSPICLCFFQQPANFVKVSRICLYLLPFVFIVLLPIVQLEAIGKILLIIPPFLLFLFKLPIKEKIYLLVWFFAIFVLGTLGARSTAIRFIVAFLFSLSLLLKHFLYTNKAARYICLIMYVTPIVLFILGVSGQLNIFEAMSENNKGKYEAAGAFDADETEDLAADTRTFIYVETIHSAITENYVIWGHSLSRGYKSLWFQSTDLISYARGERHSSEVAILNVFTHMGLIGVVLYSLIFIIASWNAILKGKSYFIKMVGLWIAFRWVYSWVEEFTRFDINYIYIWAFIAMCYSPIYLKMSDKEFLEHIKMCFPKKLR